VVEAAAVADLLHLADHREGARPDVLPVDVRQLAPAQEADPNDQRLRQADDQRHRQADDQRLEATLAQADLTRARQLEAAVTHDLVEAALLAVPVIVARAVTIPARARRIHAHRGLAATAAAPVWLARVEVRLLVAARRRTGVRVPTAQDVWQIRDLPTGQRSQVEGVMLRAIPVRQGEHLQTEQRLREPIAVERPRLGIVLRGSPDSNHEVATAITAVPQAIA
jgi:hypothetical protein